MAEIKRGLGKGLEALLPQKTTLVSGRTVLSIPIRDIVPNPRQPRHTFNEDSLKELASSIKEHGVAQPLLVRQVEDKYELIAGERRWRASKLAGLEVVPVIVKNISNEKSLELAIIENVQREDLNAIDEAESYALLMKEFDLTQEAVSQKVGKSRSAIANALRLMDLPTEIKASIREGAITAGHARAILSAGDERSQIQMWKDILAGSLSVRNAEGIASSAKARTKKSSGVSGAEEQTPLMRDVREKFSTHFSTKVDVRGSDNKGKIEIAYFSQDDLERLLELIR